MESATIKIKCPACGAVLQIQNQPGLDAKSATCPVCKTKNVIRNYIRVDNQQEEQTQYPGEGKTKEETNYRRTFEDPPTETGKGLNVIIGQLKLPSGPLYQLHMGRQTVGRKSVNPPHADCGIPTDSKRMSREHLIIEVKKEPGKGYVHYVSLFKQRVNDTFIGNNKLVFGDCIVLKNGDIIRLPDAQIQFILPDEECTTF